MTVNVETHQRRHRERFGTLSVHDLASVVSFRIILECTVLV